MTDPIESLHFKLIRDWNAFGETFSLRKNMYPSVMLIQPTNEWFCKQWNQGHTDANQSNLLYMLEKAYEQGMRETREAIRNALGIHV